MNATALPEPAMGWRGYLCVAVFCGLLVGLGEGGSPLPEATGQEAVGIAEGTVSGLDGGSVAVDGIDYADGALAPAVVASLRLGQRVRLAFDTGGSARSLAVLPQLRGPVDRAPDDDGWLQVTGQWVRIVLHPADASRSGVTLPGGYGAAAAVQVGQQVEVHGSWVFDTGKNAHVLVATRIEQRAQGGPVWTGGVVHGVAQRAFRLNTPAGVLVRADRLPPLSDGQVVAVRLASTALAADAAGLRVLEALEVRSASLGALDLAAYTTVRLGGVADGYDAASRSVRVQGTRLALAPDVALRGVPVVADGAAIGGTCRRAPSWAALQVVLEGFAPRPGAALVATRVGCSAVVPVAQGT
jgi:hypothetical protein